MKIIRPSRSTYMIFGSIGAWMCLPVFYAIKYRQWVSAALIIFLGAVICLRFFLYKISWDENILIYRSLINSRQIKFNEIEKFDVCGLSRADRYGPTIGLRIYCRKSKNPIITINIKPFARRDLTPLIEKLKKVTGEI